MTLRPGLPLKELGLSYVAASDNRFNLSVAANISSTAFEPKDYRDTFNLAASGAQRSGPGLDVSGPAPAPAAAQNFDPLKIS